MGSLHQSFPITARGKEPIHLILTSRWALRSSVGVCSGLEEGKSLHLISFINGHTAIIRPTTSIALDLQVSYIQTLEEPQVPYGSYLQAPASHPGEGALSSLILVLGVGADS